jgi:predicted XRE-type DNA-binding protein
MSTTTTKAHEKSGGNVFADIGLPDAEQTLAKAELARQIAACVNERRLTQAKAADLLGIDQPKVSALLRGKLSGFSTERLMKYLNALGHDVQIVVTPSRSASGGRVSVRLPPSRQR